MQKKTEISFLNILMCLLVIFIHITAGTLGLLHKETLDFTALFTLKRLSSFVVQGFLFLSGLKMFLKYKNQRFSYFPFLWARIKSIVIPYVLWVLIYYLYFTYNQNRLYFPFSWGEFAGYLFRGDLVGHFYFITALLQFYLLMPLWIFLFKKYSPSVMLSLSLLITVLAQWVPDLFYLADPAVPFQYNSSLFPTYLFYWTLGCYAGLYYKSFVETLEKNLVPIAVCFVLTLGCNSFFSYLWAVKEIQLYFLETLHMLYCISTLALLYALFYKLARRVSLWAFPAQINNASYNIYLSHCFFLFLAEDFCKSLFIETPLYVFLVRTAFGYLITIPVCICLHTLKNQVIPKKSKIKKINGG